MNQNKISYGIYNIESEVNDFNTSDVSLDFIIPQDLIANWKKCGIIWLSSINNSILLI